MNLRTLTVIIIFDDEFIVMETETTAATFTLAYYDGLSTAFVDFLYPSLKIMRKIRN